MKLLFSAVISIMLAPEISSAQVLFSSDWKSATGTSEAAIKDGTKWEWAYGLAAADGRSVMEVVPGGPGGLNMLRNWVRVIYNTRPSLDHSRWGAAGHSNLNFLKTENNVYFRFYVRVHRPVNYYTANGHYVQDMHAGGDMDGSQNCYWGVADMRTDKWSPYISSFRMGTNGNAVAAYGPFSFNYDQWYRYEGHIQYLEHTSHSRTIFKIRIYDLTGKLVADTSNYGAPQGMNLQQWYDSGKYWVMEGRDPTWTMGFNGPIITGPGNSLTVLAKDNISHDYMALEFRNDRWVGPDPRVETGNVQPPLGIPGNPKKLPGL